MMSNKFRIKSNPLCGTWVVYRWNLTAECWVQVYSAATKSLCNQWIDQNHY